MWDGNVFGGWAWAKGFHDRNDGTIITTFTSGFIVEDLWGNNLLKVQDTWDDWWGIDEPYFAAIPNGGTKWVDIICNGEHTECGPCINTECNRYRPEVKFGKIYWNNGIKVNVNDAEMNLNMIGVDASVTTYTYVPDLNVICKDIDIKTKRDTWRILAGRGQIDSVNEVEVKQSSSLKIVDSSSSEWFLEAAMNGGQKMSLEIPVEVAKIGVEQNFGWSVKSSTKYTTQNINERSLNYEKREKKTITQKCNSNDILYLVTRNQCISFNLKNCIANGVELRYENYHFEDSVMETCGLNEFPFCATDEAKLQSDLQVASASPGLRTHDPGSVVKIPEDGNHMA